MTGSGFRQPAARALTEVPPSMATPFNHSPRRARMTVTRGAAAPILDETSKQGAIKLEPELRPIAEQALAAFQLAATKAVAHDAAPAEYPLPAGSDHLEQIMHSRLSQRPATKRKRAQTQVLPDRK